MRYLYTYSGFFVPLISLYPVTAFLISSVISDKADFLFDSFTLTLEALRFSSILVVSILDSNFPFSLVILSTNDWIALLTLVTSLVGNESANSVNLLLKSFVAVAACSKTLICSSLDLPSKDSIL